MILTGKSGFKQSFIKPMGGKGGTVLFPLSRELLMTDEEKKDYILKNWNVSSGKKISEMLRRYFSNKDIPSK